MPQNTTPEPPSPDPRAGAARPDIGPPVTSVEDTTQADVGDNAANEATDALIDAAEADPVVPGEPRDAHQ